MGPGTRLAIASIGGIYVLKAIVLATRRTSMTRAGLSVFLLGWPGVVPDRFQRRGAPRLIHPTRFLAAWTRMAGGALCVILFGIYAPFLSDRVLGLAGIAALLLTLHLGIFDLLPWLLRWAGFDAPLLFDRPWAACSLAEFWGRRWNLAFVEMNERLLLRPLHRRLGRNTSRLALFALSGLLHEAGLSWPAGAGWGLPFAYFMLQGLMIQAEERFGVSGRAWTYFWVLTPTPWLFHEPFRRALIVPFYRTLHEWMTHHNWEWYLSLLLYAAAAGTVSVLAASLQALLRLGWRDDIAKLRRFNQKVFWVYGFYILLSIVSFAVLTWRLHDAFLAGDTTARWLAGFIAVFWTVRVLVDVFCYDHRDWPPGNAMVAGHALVTTLFCFLATVYWVAAVG